MNRILQPAAALAGLAAGVAGGLATASAQGVSQVAMPGVASKIPEYPSGVAESMIMNDFAWASENRGRILTEWTKRYEGKAAKK